MVNWCILLSTGTLIIELPKLHELTSISFCFSVFREILSDTWKIRVSQWSKGFARSFVGLLRIGLLIEVYHGSGRVYPLVVQNE